MGGYYILDVVFAVQFSSNVQFVFFSGSSAAESVGVVQQAGWCVTSKTNNVCTTS